MNSYASVCNWWLCGWVAVWPSASKERNHFGRELCIVKRAVVWAAGCVAFGFQGEKSLGDGGCFFFALI